LEVDAHLTMELSFPTGVGSDQDLCRRREMERPADLRPWFSSWSEETTGRSL